MASVTPIAPLIVWKHVKNAKEGYNASLAQSYASYTPTSGVKVGNLAIAFSNDRGTAIASWSAVANAVSYEVMWWYKIMTTGGAKWLAASTSYQNVGTATTSSYSIPSGAVAVDCHVRPVSGTYTYSWQTNEKKTESHKYKNSKGEKKTAKRTYYVYTTHTETRYYFTGADNYISGGVATDQAAMPSAPSAPVLTAGSDGRVSVELSSTSGTYLKVWLGLYQDGAWGNHSGGKSYGPYSSGEVDVANVFTAVRGHAYRMDARQQNTVLGTYSDYSSFSDMLEMPPCTPANLSVTMLSGNAFQASWDKVAYTGDSFDLRWATDPTGMTLDDPPSGVQEVSVTGGVTSYSGQVTAGTWYFCVRAVGEGSSAWTTPAKFTLGMTPEAPTIGTLPSYAVIGQELTLTWTYNNADGSAQAGYQVQRKVGSGSWTSEASGSTSTASVTVQTSSLSDGAQLKLRVRTQGATGDWSDWSESHTVTVMAPVSATIEVTSTGMPVTVQMSATANVRSWHLVVASTEQATITLPDGTIGVLPAGSVAFEGLLTYGDEGFDPLSVEAELGFADASFAYGVTYTATLTVVSSYGLVDTDTATFAPVWDASAPQPTAVVPDPGDDYIAHIFPECRDFDAEPTGGVYPLREDVELSVYRMDSDGKLLLVADGLENTGSVEVIDPHPNFGECIYRVAARATDGSLGFYDAVCELPCGNVVIQFETGLRSYGDDMFDGNGIFELPYNLEIGESYSGDAALVEFIGNPDPTLYAGTQLGRTASVETAVLTTDDADVVSRVRMLAGNMSRAYYRDPTGLGFWAWVVPSLKWNHANMVQASFAVTRIMGDYAGEV